MSTVVLLRALGLGDLLTAVPALRAARESFSDRRTVLVTTAGVAPLARHLALADDVVTAEPLAPVPESIGEVDVAVNLHGRGPQSHRLLQACHPRELLAFANAEAEVSGPQWRDDEHEVGRWCRLLESFGISADATDLYMQAPDVEPAVAIDDETTVLHPGASASSRRWPVDRWANVARHERKSGRQVLITGSGDERLIGERVAMQAGLPAQSVVAGGTDLLQLAALVARAGRVVCGDTGIAHLATALRVPSVVLFGPVSPERWGPPKVGNHHVALWHGFSGDPHASALDAGLARISVDEVIGALENLPTRSSIASGAPALSASTR